VKERLSERHKNTFNRVPASQFYAPIPVNLLGDYCDYGGGTTLTLNTSLGVYAAVSVRDDFTTVFDMSLFGKEASATIDMRHLNITHENSLYNVFAAFLSKCQYEGHTMENGLNITFMTSLAEEMNVFIAPTLLSLFAEIVDVSNDFRLSREKKVRYSLHARDAVLGHKTTVSPLYAAFFGTEGSVLSIDTKRLEGTPFSLEDMDVALWMFVVKQPAFAVDPELSSHIRAFSKALDAIREYREIEALCDLDVATFTDYKRFISSRKALMHAEHVVFENDRVAQGIESIKDREPVILGDLMDQSHHSQHHLLDATNSFQETLVKMAVETGALGAKRSFFSSTPVVLALFDEALDAESFKYRFHIRMSKHMEAFRIVPDGPIRHL